MNRTHALFGLAASLVVGAAIVEHLVFRTGAPPPRPISDSDPVAEPAGTITPGTAISSIRFGDLVKLDAALSNAYVLGGRDDELYLRLDLDAADVRAVERPPMALSIVFDRSGSMEGDKIERTRLAAKQLVDRLSDRDRVAIVSYATDYEVNLSLTEVGRAGRARIHRIIDELYVGGGTNLSSGLEAGLEEVARAGDGMLKRVVLMSDGNANQGETDPNYLARVSRRARLSGATVATLGVGVDFNEDLMTLLAESGGGAYYYARDADAIARALEAELDGLVAVAARGVELALALGDGVTVDRAYGYTTELRDGRVIIPVGDMASGEHRQVVLRLQVSPRLETLTPVAEVTLRYTPAKGDVLRTQTGELSVLAISDPAMKAGGVRPDVIETVEETLAAESRRTAAIHYSLGERRQADELLRQQVDKTRAAALEMNSTTLWNQVHELEATILDMNKADFDSEAGRDLVKREKYQARMLHAY